MAKYKRQKKNFFGLSATTRHIEVIISVSPLRNTLFAAPGLALALEAAPALRPGEDALPLLLRAGTIRRVCIRVSYPGSDGYNKPERYDNDYPKDNRVLDDLQAPFVLPEALQNIHSCSSRPDPRWLSIRYTSTVLVERFSGFECFGLHRCV